jgi:hypothetical protein
MRELKLEHDRFQAQVAELAQTTRSHGHVIEDELKEALAGMENAATRINGLIKQVQALGCALKDIDQGLIDFPSMMNGHEVYLCWKLGEERISWWHELGVGFAGRQPLEERE